LTGHLYAFFTILIWGTTFVVARTLVNAGLRPVEIIFYRFIMGWLCLLILNPRGFRLPISLAALKEDKFLIFSGLTLIPVYFMLEKTAVVYSTATNTSLLVAMSPLFIVLISRFILKRGHIKKSFTIGALLCFCGVFLIVTSGNFTLAFNPLGDFLAIGAGLASAAYILLGEQLGRQNHINDITRMQRIFFYGLLLLLPIMPLSGFRLESQLLLQPTVILQLVYLGFAASALAFTTWNKALNRLGALSTGLYIYLIPVVTISSAIIFLDEQLTIFSALGAFLIICGLIVAENWLSRRLATVKSKI